MSVRPNDWPVLHAVVQAHPARKVLAESLRESLGLSSEISYHASDPPSPWAGYQLALQRGLDAETNPTHVLVIQEDTLVCRNFGVALERIARSKPHEPVCLFLSWLPVPEKRASYQAALDGEHYIRSVTSAFCPVVAILWPREAAERFLAWTQSGVKLPNHRGFVASDDAVLARWIQRCHETVWITVPSLVEHPDDAVSVKGRQRAIWGPKTPRMALQWIGDGDPLAIAW